MTYPDRDRETGEEENRPLTPEEEKQLKLGKLWRYGCPALLLVLAIVFRDRLRETVAAGLLLYALLTWRISRGPSAAFVFVLRKKRGERIAYPEEEREKARFREDGKWMSLIYAAGAVMLMILALTGK